MIYLLYFVVLPTEIVMSIVISAVLAGLALSLVGTFVVHMKITSVGFCMSHAAFAGAALGLLMQSYGSIIDPIIMAGIFSVVIALILGPLSDKTKLDSNIILGILFSLMIGLGFIFISLMPEGVTGASSMAIIWGSLFGLTDQEMLVLLILNISLVLLIILFYKEFTSIMLHRKIALAAGIRVNFFKFLILLATAIAVSFSLNIVGAFLVYAMIVNPTSTVYQFVYDTKKLFIFSPIVGAITVTGGIFLSLWADFPISSSIIIFSSAIFAISIFFSPKHRKAKKNRINDKSEKKIETIKDFFNERAQNWDNYTNHDPIKLNHIMEVLNLKAGNKVLDVGSGTGVMIPYIHEYVKNEGRIVAIDIAEEMISISKEKYSERFPNIEFIIDDVNEIDIKNTYDAIICYSCFPHFLNQVFILKKLTSALKVGGKLMIAHSESRKTINDIHKNVQAIVSNERLPPMKKLLEMMENESLQILNWLDNNEMYYVIGSKNSNIPNF